MVAWKSKNKKVKNATKCSWRGVEFDSELEMFFYKALVSQSIPFEFKPTYTLQEKFRYEGKAVQDIQYTPDFFIANRGIVVDTKGWKTEAFNLKLKMLKKHFLDNNICYKIELPRTTKECTSLIYKIKANLI